MKTGNISVQTENIFPIIKKFLYSEHEIFLRELVSNATDAATKLKTLAARGEKTGDIDNLKVEISINKDAKTLSIKDNGIGMSAEEVEKYINQIAFSGAKEFVSKFESAKDAGIIGNFGLGFYSAFMVAKKVELLTKSYTDAPAVKWSCDGSVEYTLEEIEKADRGTEVILHLNEEDEQYLESARIKELLNKFCKFLPVAVWFENEQINAVEPIWVKKPSDLKDEDYTNFYRELYPMSFEQPLFHIHLNVDYPFNLTGVLYFPRLDNKMDIQRNKIKLYCNRVFVSESVEGIVPDFLMLLHGVIDSPDIPLNVSRSYLQGDPNVKKISSHITKKVSDKLAEMNRTNPEDYHSKWEDIKMFVNYGLVTEDKFADKYKDFFLFKSINEDKWYNVDAYVEKISATQKDKNGKTVILYSNDPVIHHSYIASAKEYGYDVILMNTPLDAHVINKLESLNADWKFSRVDADSLDKLIDKGETRVDLLSEEEKTTLKGIFESIADKETYVFETEAMSDKDAPVVVTENEFMRRMQEMNAIGGGGFMGAFPEKFQVKINTNHSVYQKLLKEEGDKNAKVEYLFYLGLLNRNMLKGEELSKFMKHSLNLI